MKIRCGFVSNSSSSSFILDRQYISPLQEYQIENHINESKTFKDIDFSFNDEDDKWDVSIKKKVIIINTEMNNFDMRCFLDYIGVPKKAIIEEGKYVCWWKYEEEEEEIDEDS